MAQHVKIFAWCANGETSGTIAGQEIEKKINAFLQRYPTMRIISVTPLMNSGIDWTEMSVTVVFEKPEKE